MAEKAGQVDGLLSDVERLQKELEEGVGASQKKIEEMEVLLAEKEKKVRPTSRGGVDRAGLG